MRQRRSCIRHGLVLGLLGLGLLGLAIPLAAQPTVSIVYPTAEGASYGELEVSAVVSGGAVESVEFYVDGVLAGTVAKPPYRLKVDVGYENTEHRYRVVARDASGGLGEASVVTPAIKVDMQLDVELKQLYVTVRRGGSRNLENDRGDFRIFDNGATQEIVTFERGEVPITAVVLLDASESMQDGRLEKALSGARSFFSGLRELDQAMVLLFSDRLVRSTDFSSDQAVFASALQGVRAEGGTAVNDHLYLALKRLETQPGRPVVILFSDGTDVHSALPMREVLWKANRSQALIYWILLEGEGKSGGDTITTAWRNGPGNKEEVELLRKAVDQSGGTVVSIARVEELAGAFRDILAELREQYVLGYYPNNLKSDGSWHKVKVDLTSSTASVRHRGGYVDE